MLSHPTPMWRVDSIVEADGYGPNMSARNHRIVFNKSERDVIDAANPRRTLDDGVEHRLHVCGRTADNAEHFGGCRLVLQRFGELTSALLRLFGCLGELAAQLRHRLCFFNRGLFRRISGRLCSVALRTFFARHNIQPEIWPRKKSAQSDLFFHWPLI